jgi:diacylglycerol O-acyltransferase
MTPQLSCLDRFFLELETPWRGAHWALVMELEDAADGGSSTAGKALSPSAIQVRVRERIEMYPLFKLGVTGGRWRQPELQEYSVDQALTCVSSAMVSDEQHFRDLLSQLLAVPLTRDRPSWRIILINQRQPEVQRLVLLVHHSMSDGVAGAGYTALLADGDDNQLRQLDRFVHSGRYPAPSVPVKVFRTAAKALVSSWNDGRGSRRLPKLGKNRHRAVATLQLPTAKLRHAASKLSASTSEFLVAAIGAGLTDSVAAALPAHQHPATFRAYVPATLDTELRHTGNAVSMVLVNLPGGGVTQEQRIASARDQLRTIAERQTALALPAVAQLSGTTPWPAQCAASRIMMTIMAPDLHLGINPSYVKLDAVLGRKLGSIYPLSPLLGNVLSLTCQIVAGSVYIGIVWDPDTLGHSFGSNAVKGIAALVPDGHQLVGGAHAQS